LPIFGNINGFTWRYITKKSKANGIETNTFRCNNIFCLVIICFILASELDRFHSLTLTPDDVFFAIRELHKKVNGAYAVSALIIGHGMLAFRDPDGIRPLTVGFRKTDNNQTDRFGYYLFYESLPSEAEYHLGHEKLAYHGL
jgi:glutamine phosphoribosylpyrophosphate amidotransferase